MTTPIKVEFRAVGKTFPARNARPGTTAPFHALRDFSLRVHQGEFLTLVGPSGCGKSTLLDLLAGLARPTSGAILVDGKPVLGPGPDRGVVFQQYALLPWRTALGNVEFGLEIKKTAAGLRKETARRFLDLVGLAGFENHYPHELSGGMKQRVAIARSLACDPEVLLMDEPFAALDAQTRETLQGELLEIWRKTAKTIVFITHSIDEAVYLGQRVAVMSYQPGRIKEIVEIPASLRSEGVDSRALPAFGELRHRIGELLSEELNRSQVHETLRYRAASLAASHRFEEVPAHGL